MAHEQYTRCPGCSTIFRVTPEQLALREGQVRCGHCRTVFDGTAHLISLAPTPQPEREADELVSGPPTVTLRRAHALRPATEEGEATRPRETIGSARVTTGASGGGAGFLRSPAAFTISAQIFACWRCVGR